MQCVMAVFADELVSAARKYLERCTSQTSLNLRQLAKVENKMVDDNKDFPNFPELGQGSFLDFILENEALRKVKKCCVVSFYLFPTDLK